MYNIHRKIYLLGGKNMQKNNFLNFLTKGHNSRQKVQNNNSLSIFVLHQSRKVDLWDYTGSGSWGEIVRGIP